MSKLANLRSRLARMKERSEETLTVLSHDMSGALSSGIAGYVRGRTEERARRDGKDPAKAYKVLGVEPEVVVAAPLKALAYYLTLGNSKAAPIAHGMSDGPLFFVAGLKGLELGEKHVREDNNASTGRRQMGQGSVSNLRQKIHEAAAKQE